MVQRVEPEVDNFPVQEITIELIRSLKNRGLSVEANLLLKRFHKDKKKMKRQITKEIKHNDYRIKKHYCEKYNLCKLCAIKLREEGQYYCKKCLTYRKKKPVFKEQQCFECLSIFTPITSRQVICAKRKCSEQRCRRLNAKKELSVPCPKCKGLFQSNLGVRQHIPRCKG